MRMGRVRKDPAHSVSSNCPMPLQQPQVRRFTIFNFRLTDELVRLMRPIQPHIKI